MIPRCRYCHRDASLTRDRKHPIGGQPLPRKRPTPAPGSGGFVCHREACRARARADAVRAYATKWVDQCRICTGNRGSALCDRHQWMSEPCPKALPSGKVCGAAVPRNRGRGAQSPYCLDHR